MALITCKDCNNNFSTDASRCPSCGARKPSNIGRTLVITFLVIFMLGFCEAVKNPPPQQTQKPPLDYSKQVYTDDYATVCPESLFFDRQAETPQKIVSLFISAWGVSEKAKELGCEIWQGGIPVYAQKMDTPFDHFVAIGTSLPTTLFTVESHLKNSDAAAVSSTNASMPDVQSSIQTEQITGPPIELPEYNLTEECRETRDLLGLKNYSPELQQGAFGNCMRVETGEHQIDVGLWGTTTESIHRRCIVSINSCQDYSNRTMPPSYGILHACLEQLSPHPEMNWDCNKGLVNAPPESQNKTIKLEANPAISKEDARLQDDSSYADTAKQKSPLLKNSASFDCGKARSTLEILICSDIMLSSLDQEVGHQFNTAKLIMATDAQKSKELLTAQRKFLKGRTMTCPIPMQPQLSNNETQQIITCLQKYYQSRIDALLRKITDTVNQRAAFNGISPIPKDKMQLGDCTNTTIKKITTRLDNTPGSGTEIIYANGIYGVSYETVTEAENSNVGDPVRVCLIDVPENCPPNDNSGRYYVATNLKTNLQWSLPDSEHSCGN